MKVGENVNLQLSGQLGVGYSGDFGTNYVQSSHGMFLSGAGSLNGSYYDPRFLNFTIQPFYNRNQDSSETRSIFSDSGVSASVNLFSGSHFPGSISYGRSSNEGSQFGIAGLETLSSNGTTRNFAVTWSAFLPKFPSLTATIFDDSSSDSILGDTGEAKTGIRGVNLFSNYSVAGFHLSGNLNHQGVDSTIPEFLTGSSVRNNSSSTSYGISATHSLPLSGNFGIGFTKSSYSSESNSGMNNDGTSETADGTVSFNPTRKFSISGGVRYYDSLVGALPQSLLSNGSVPLNFYNVGTNGVTFNAFGTYNFGHSLNLIGYASRQMQYFQGNDFASNQYGATLTYNYARPLFGMLNFSFGMVNTAGNGNQGTLGFVTNLGLKKQLHGWDINLDVTYNQAVQSSIALFTTSNFNYGGMIRRRFGANTYWTTSARSVQTGLTQLGGYNTRSETFMTNLIRGRFGVSGSYSRSNGTSILSSTGALIPTPLAPVLSPDEVLYGGVSYGAGFSVTPMRRMVITANWMRSSTSTTTNTIYSNNENNRFYSEMQYHLRKLIFRATYWRINQVISASSLPRGTENSYSFTISRWFNIF